MLLICAACGHIQIMHLIIIIFMICQDNCQSTFPQCRFVQFHGMKTSMFIMIVGFAYTKAIFFALAQGFRAAPGQLPGRSRAAPGQLPGSSRAAPGQLPGSSWAAPGQLPGSFRAVPGQLPRSSRVAPGQLPGSSRAAPSRANEYPSAIASVPSTYHVFAGESAEYL